jgi:hypothetical protein
MESSIGGKKKYHPRIEQLLENDYWREKWGELQRSFEYPPNEISKSDLRSLYGAKNGEKKKVAAKDYEKAFRRFMNIFVVLYELCGVIPRDVEEIKQDYAEKPLKRDFYKGMEKTNLYTSLRGYEGLSSNHPTQKHIDLLVRKDYLTETRIPRGIAGNPIIIAFGKSFFMNESLLRLIFSVFEGYIDLNEKIEHMVFRFMLQKVIFEPLRLQEDEMGVKSLINDFFEFLSNRDEFVDGLTIERKEYFTQTLVKQFLQPILEICQHKDSDENNSV